MKTTKYSVLIILMTVSSAIYGQHNNSDSFSSRLKKSDVKTVLKAVADWQIKTPLEHNTADWTNGALYTGMVEWASVAGSDMYYTWLRGLAEKNQWSKMERDDPGCKYFADDYCVGQVYLELYRKYKDLKMIRPMQEYFDQIIAHPATGDLKFVNTENYRSTERWSWCDALFMGPTVWARMANITGEKKYLDFMFKEYKATTDYLYDTDEDLYYRDSNYFTIREANGKKVFWGRGNGWVFAGLPIIIRELPSSYEHKDFFTGIFRKMAAKLLKLQLPDGSWHASLLDPDSFPNPEMSATAFFVFGMAWGIDNGYLDKATYKPVVEKGWRMMVSTVFPDGKVGFIQPIGSDPKAVTKDMTEVYGVGGFLLAGTEILKMIEKGI